MKKTKKVKPDLAKFLINNIPKEILHELLEQYDDGRLDKTVQDYLYPVDAERYPQEYDNF